MKDEVALFLLEKAMKIHGVYIPPESKYGMFFNPYNQFPRFRPDNLSAMDRRFIREHGTNYKLYPHLTRSGLAVAATSIPSLVATSAVATVIAQTELARRQNYVPTGGQGSGFGATFSFFESLGITI